MNPNEAKDLEELIEFLEIYSIQKLPSLATAARTAKLLRSLQSKVLIDKHHAISALAELRARQMLLSDEGRSIDELDEAMTHIFTAIQKVKT